jgi:hypothetical protein
MKVRDVIRLVEQDVGTKLRNGEAIDSLSIHLSREESRLLVIHPPKWIKVPRTVS